MKESVESRAMEAVINHYKKQSWDVENVSRARGSHGGYDLLVKKDGKEFKIEVKGCTELFGIPDPYFTEFDKDSRKLIADFLCVAYVEVDPPKLAIIPREAIPPEYVIPKFGYRISGKFKNSKSISPFLVNLDKPAAAE